MKRDKYGDLVNEEGLKAYDILMMPNCPIKLPKSRSMTSAMIDYRRIEESCFEWYNSIKPN